MKHRQEKLGGQLGKTAADAVAPPAPQRLVGFLCLAIGLATLAVYSRAPWFGFVFYDDPQYVYMNPLVKAGLTAPGFARAFFSFYPDNWIPLTMISHMLDCQLFGVNAGAHHLVSVVFHTFNALLLFLVLMKMTGRPWRSAVVAGIFAVHPLHVESVAWIAERKDVLSAFFGMTTLLLYFQYVQSSTARRFFWVALAFALGVMAKPMLVTFPLVLLLLDLWPLRRFDWPPDWPTLKPFLREKTPLLAISAVSCVLTFLAQRSGAVIALSRIPLSTRLANGAVAYVSYLGEAFWPENLAVLYPYQLPRAENVFGAGMILALATLASLMFAKRRPYLLVGWLWYLGMLVPVIGIVQVGAQSMADRYTYLPLVGFSLALVWGAADLAENHPLLRNMTAILAGAAAKRGA